MMTMEQRLAVLAEAQSWLRTPYNPGQRVKGRGVDCLHFLIGAYAGAGLISEIDPGTYARDWHLHHSEERYLLGVSQYMTQTQTPDIADVVLFKFGRCVSHGAILVSDTRVIHAYLHMGVVESELTDAELVGRLHSYWTLKE